MKSYTNLLKILSDETRLRILNLFIKSHSNLCVCEIMDALKIPQYAVSKALNQIKKAGLLSFSKEGTWVYYDLDYSSTQNKLLFEFLDKFFNDAKLNEDIDRLNKRLKLRENQKCVVGIIPEEELLKKIKAKRI